MRYEIPSYVHATGRHCGSGSLVNLCRHHGIAVSEPLVVGLGCGLGFGYFAIQGFSPSRGLFTRGATLESDFCERLGIRLEARRESDPPTAWQKTRRDLLAGGPVMLNSDILELRYFGSKTHFNGHKTLLVGFDDEAQTALISDTEFDDIQTEPFETLSKARASRHPPVMDGGSPWYVFEFPKRLHPLPEAIRTAVALQARRMLEAKPPLGALAIEQAAADLPRWSEAPDWKWCARFAYQIIERRGTGGGAFRKMYAEFLEEAAPLVPPIGRAGLPGQMARIASDWTELAAEFKRQSDLERAPDFSAAAAMLGKIGKAEAAFYEAALSAAGN